MGMEKEILWQFEEVIKEEPRAASATLEKALKDLEGLEHAGHGEMAFLLRQPFLAVQDTVYGSKEHYGDIVSVWNQYDGPVKGWVLLAVIDTMESVSRMIYEHYQALRERFRSMLSGYLQNMEPDSSDVLAGLAIIKACRMDVVLAEHYAKTGLSLVKAPRKGDPAAEGYLQKAAMKQWESVKKAWGMEDED